MTIKQFIKSKVDEINNEIAQEEQLRKICNEVTEIYNTNCNYFLVDNIEVYNCEINMYVIVFVNEKGDLDIVRYKYVEYFY